ncbi:MAG: hypothetical protein ACC628_07605 [Pirellulaceae bacterium]
MTDSTKPKASLTVACLLLSGAMLLAFPGFAAYGHARHGTIGVYAAATAGAICWAGALGALVLAGLLQGGPHAIHATLLGTFFRMGGPLIAGLLMNQTGGPLAEAGVFGMIVGYYLVGLVVETLLSVRLIGRSAGGAARVS